jgi:hypothetical protein
MALGLVLPTIAADKQDLENRVKQLNSVGAKPEMQDIAFQRISTETGVPVETVRKQHQRHPNVGVAGLMMANVLADETKKTPEQFLGAHDKGKNWVTIAQQNNVSVDKLNERLDRLAKAISG